METNLWTLLFYSLSVVIIEMPLILAAMLIGRHTRLNSIHVIYTLTRDSDATKAASIAWSIIGLMHLLLAAAILVFFATKLLSLDYSTHPVYSVSLNVESMMKVFNASCLSLQLSIILGLKYGSKLPANTSLLIKSFTIFIANTLVFIGVWLIFIATSNTTLWNNFIYLMHISVPLCLLLQSIFVGWVIKRKIAKKELPDLGYTGFNVWYAMVRVFIPISLALLLAFNVQL